jgi:hypothetical protein
MKVVRVRFRRGSCPSSREVFTARTRSRRRQVRSSKPRRHSHEDTATKTQPRRHEDTKDSHEDTATTTRRHDETLRRHGHEDTTTKTRRHEGRPRRHEDTKTRRMGTKKELNARDVLAVLSPGACTSNGELAFGREGHRANQPPRHGGTESLCGRPIGAAPLDWLDAELRQTSSRGTAKR